VYRTFFSGWGYYFFGPLVVILITASIWVTVSAAMENYRTAQAKAQMYNIIAMARDMRIRPDAETRSVSREFFRRVADARLLQVVQLEPAFLGSEAELGFKNPWDGSVRVFFYPSAQAMRLEMPVSPPACRKMLRFVADKKNDLKLRSIDIADDEPRPIQGTQKTLLWRKLYEAGKELGFTSEAIDGQCRDGAHNLLLLTFNLSDISP